MDTMDIVERIRDKARTGTEIPKPAATEPFRVKGWGIRRGENALIYSIPNKRGGRPYEKGITVSEMRTAFKALQNTGVFTRSWFNQNMAACAREGGCNFTTIGGLFSLLAEAKYEGTGSYRKV